MVVRQGVRGVDIFAYYVWQKMQEKNLFIHRCDLYPSSFRPPPSMTPPKKPSCRVHGGPKQKKERKRKKRKLGSPKNIVHAECRYQNFDGEGEHFARNLVREGRVREKKENKSSPTDPPDDKSQKVRPK